MSEVTINCKISLDPQGRLSFVPDDEYRIDFPALTGKLSFEAMPDAPPELTGDAKLAADDAREEALKARELALRDAEASVREADLDAREAALKEAESKLGK